jgi:hypothetical protein
VECRKDLDETPMVYVRRRERKQEEKGGGKGMNEPAGGSKKDFIEPVWPQWYVGKRERGRKGMRRGEVAVVLEAVFRVRQYLLVGIFQL